MVTPIPPSLRTSYPTTYYIVSEYIYIYRPTEPPRLTVEDNP